MWFKIVLLGYFAALLAVTIVTASSIEDTPLSKRQHLVERIDIPSLERRQLPIRNQTSSSEISQSTSVIITTLSEVVPSDIPQTSTFVQTPSAITSLESTATFAPIPTSSSGTIKFPPFRPSSSNGDIPPTSSFISTKVITLPSSTFEQEPSETPSQFSTIPSASEPLGDSTTSTLVVNTPTFSSSIGEAQTSGTIETSQNNPGPTVEPTPSSSQVASTAKFTSPSSETSASVSVPETVQLPSDTVSISSSDIATPIPTIESAQPSVPASSTQIVTSETISTVISNTPSETHSSTLSHQQSTTVSSFSADPTSSAELSSTTEDSISSSLVVKSSSSSQELITTPAPAQPSVSTLTPELSSDGAQVSSSDGLPSSISELQPTTIATISDTETESSVPPSVTSEIVSSTPISSNIEPTPTTPQSSVAEIPSPSFLTSILETLTSPIASVTQPPPSTSSEYVLSSSSFVPLPTSSAESTSIGLPASLSTQSIIATSSTQTLDPLPSVQLPSSSTIEVSSSVFDAPSTSSLAMSSENSLLPSAITGVDVSVSTISTTSSSSFPTLSASLSSQTNEPASSSVDSISSESTSLLGISSVTPTPFPTAVESMPPITPSEAPISTGFIATSEISSTSSVSEITSSFAPSETLSTSATSPNLSSKSPELSAGAPPELSSSISAVSGTQPTISEPSSTVMSSLLLSTLSAFAPSEAIITQISPSTTVQPEITSTVPSLIFESFSSISIASDRQPPSSHNPTSVVFSSTTNSTASTSIPTSEASGPGSTHLSRESSLNAIPTQSDFLSFASSGVLATGTAVMPLPTSIMNNGTQTQVSTSMTPGVVTATFSTVYISSIRSSTLDMSTVAFSLFSSVTEAAVNQNQTKIRTSSEILATLSAKVSGTLVPASETLTSSAKLGLGANSTWSSPMLASLSTPVGSPGNLNSTATKTTELGITFSRSALPTDASSSIVSRLNETHAETLQTSSLQSAVNSTTSGFIASATSDSTSSAQTDTLRSTSTYGSDESSTTDSPTTDESKTAVAPGAPSNTPSETASAGSPPPLTTSQTAGVAVGATTGLLIAVVAAIFIARRYHAAKQGKRMSTGSVYPKVAYLYDPKTGGYGGDAEALMSGATGGMPPGSHVSGVAQGSLGHMQRHSTGTMPVTRFTGVNHAFNESIRDPTTHRYSDYARLDTARALSAAVAGYGAAPRHSASFIRHQSNGTDPFSDHIIPSPTFAPFSPDDIRRPEPKPDANDRRGEYSQVPISTYSYLNTAASMYPPISPYERPSTQGPSPPYDTRRHTVDSNPFADPFEHDLLLQVDERNRTSDSVTVFASSPNLMSPRTPRTPVGPQLPVRQPNGMTSARSLLSPVAAKYMHKAQEVKIPRKSIASPVLVQVGRSPVIKPFSPPPAAPEHRGWDEFKRHSEKHFSDDQSVPAPLKFASPVVQRKPVAASHIPMKPSLTGAGPALSAGSGLPLTVHIPHMYKKSVGLDVPRVNGGPDPAHESMSNDPVVREKRSRELRFADPTLIGKEF